MHSLFLVLVPTYLVLIAYGMVGLRKRPISGGARVAAAALLVLIPPVAIIASLYGADDVFLVAGRGIALAMLASGVIAAMLTWYIAGRTA